MSENFDLIPQDVKDNYTAIAAEREVSFDGLAEGVERTGDPLLAAYLRSQAHASAPAKARAAKPHRTAAAD